jgi:hypothetical protein
MSLALQPDSLVELQRAFRASVYGTDDFSQNASLHTLVTEGKLSADVRLGIYRNNTVSNLCNALKADYPVVEKLVGDDFFRHAAKCFIAETPSTSGDINDYGESFPEFLATFPAAAGLPYLGDVARLERAWKHSFFAADAEAADWSGLNELSPELLGDVRFHLHPAVHLMSSSFPVMQIWSANQSEASSPAEIRLDAGAEWILLRRPHAQVEMELLAPGEYAWLAALFDGRSLAAAVDAAFCVMETFELAPCLQRHIGQSTFIGYSLGGN